jgi:hypothetical protein
VLPSYTPPAAGDVADVVRIGKRDNKTLAARPTRVRIL